MTRDELIELFQENLTGGNTTDDIKGKFHPEVLAAYLDLAIEELSSQALRGRRRRYQSIDTITKTYSNLEVQKDTDRDEKYIDIPVSYLNLPFGKQIVSVAPQKAPREGFSRVGINQVHMLEGLEAADEVESYYLEKDRIYFHKIQDYRKKLRLVMVPRLRELGGDEEINVPDGRTVELFELAKRLIVEQRQTKEEVENNNKPDFG